VLKEK